MAEQDYTAVGPRPAGQEGNTGVPICPPPSEAHPNCKTCAGHFFSAVDQVNPKHRYRMRTDDTEGAQNSATKILLDTSEDLLYVRQKLQTHGDVVLSSWSKKSAEKRAALLLTAEDVFPSWPGQPLSVPQDDLPFTTDLWDFSNCIWGQWLDINSFAKDRMKLLSLLQMRTAYGPEAWAVFDLCESRWYFNPSQMWRMDYCPVGIIMHGSSFGTLTRFDAELAHRGTVVGFPRALYAISAQNAIASMLRTLIDAITADKQPSGCTKWTALVSKGMRSSLEEPWSTYYSQAFLPPSPFDPATMLQKSRNHLNLIKDEIQLMQTSPEYMHQYITELKANFCCEHGITEQKLWYDMAWCMITFWLEQLQIWQRNTLEFDNLCSRIAALGIAIEPGVHLPKEIDIAVKACGTKVEDALRVLALNMNSPLRTMSIQRRRCRRGIDGHPETSFDRNDPGDRVLRATRGLQQQIVKQEPYGLSGSVRLLERELAKDNVPRSKNMRIALSSIVDLLELRVPCFWNQMALEGTPASDMEVHMYSEQRDMLPRDLYEKYKSQGGNKPIELPNSLSPTEQGRCSKLLREFVELPVPTGCKDSKWLSKMTESRKRLGAFWQCVREDYEKTQRGLQRGDVYIQAMLAHISFDKSPQYLAEVKDEQRRVEDRARHMDAERAQHLTKRMEEQRKAQKVKVQEMAKDAPFVQQAWDKTSAKEDAAYKPTVTPKVKTTCESSLETEQAMQNLQLHGDERRDDEDTGGVEATQIPVNKDSLSVMERLFSNPNSVGEKGVRWNTLQQALEDAGMVATANGGSKVTFANQQGSICLHSPHPEPTVDAIRLRGFGRRLSKWFGWDLDTFILRKKVGTEREGENDLTQPLVNA